MYIKTRRSSKKVAIGIDMESECECEVAESVYAICQHRADTTTTARIIIMKSSDYTADGIRSCGATEGERDSEFN